jgi:hypothetical protein
MANETPGKGIRLEMVKERSEDGKHLTSEDHSPGAWHSPDTESVQDAEHSPAIVVKNLGKRFRRHRPDRPKTLKVALLGTFRRRKPAGYF